MWVGWWVCGWQLGGRHGPGEPSPSNWPFLGRWRFQSNSHPASQWPWPPNISITSSSADLPQPATTCHAGERGRHALTHCARLVRWRGRGGLRSIQIWRDEKQKRKTRQPGREQTMAATHRFSWCCFCLLGCLHGVNQEFWSKPIHQVEQLVQRLWRDTATQVLSLMDSKTVGGKDKSLLHFKGDMLPHYTYTHTHTQHLATWLSDLHVCISFACRSSLSFFLNQAQGV